MENVLPKNQACRELSICYCYPGVPPEVFSWGIGTLIQEYIHMFSGTIHTVTIVSRSEGELYSVEKLASNIELHRLPTAEGWLEKIINRLSGGKYKLLFFSYRLKKYLKKLVSDKKIDIIESADWGGEMFFPLRSNLKEKIIVRVSTPSFVSEKYNPSNKSYLGPIAKLMEIDVLKRARIVIVPNPEIEDDFRKAGIKRADYIYQFVYPYTGAFVVNSPHKQKEQGIGNISFVFTGRLEERKGIEHLFQTLAQLLHAGENGFKFHFFGADTFKDNMSVKRYLLEKYDLLPFVDKVLIFHGPVSRVDLLCALEKYDVLILSSIFELVGYTAIEAMAKGAMLVSNKTGHLIHVLEDKKDMLVYDYRDEGALLQIMRSIINQKCNITEIRLHGQEKIRQMCEPNQCLAMLVDLYYQLIH